VRTNLTSTDPAELWHYYIQLVQVEQAFKELKGDLAVHLIGLPQRQDSCRLPVASLAPGPAGPGASAPSAVPGG